LTKEKSRIIEITQKKLLTIGGSFYINIPKDWAKQHEFKPGKKITIILNSDLKLLSPEHAEKLYNKLIKKEIQGID